MVIGIARVKDEADIIEPIVLHMLEQVDYVLIEDNASTDGTLEIVRALPVELLLDPTVGYYQAAAMTRLASCAAALGADWIVPFDADEFWYSPFGRIADVLMEQTTATIATAALYDHVATAEDPDGVSALDTIHWRRPAPAPLPKVACRPSVNVAIRQGNHGADYNVTTLEGLFVIRHFPYRSAQQVIRKIRNGAAAYAATDLPLDMGAHWRGWGQVLAEHGEDAIADLFRKWHWRTEPSRALVIDGEDQPPLVFDPARAACPSPS